MVVVNLLKYCCYVNLTTLLVGEGHVEAARSIDLIAILLETAVVILPLLDFHYGDQLYLT